MKLSTLTAAALFGFAVVAAPAMAQDTSPSAGATQGGAAQGGAAVDAQATGAVTGQAQGQGQGQLSPELRGAAGGFFTDDSFSALRDTNREGVVERWQTLSAAEQALINDECARIRDASDADRNWSQLCENIGGM